MTNVVWTQVDPQRITCRTTSEDETAQLGQELASTLESGDVVALIGDLGAGKTRLVKSVAAACGVPLDQVNSPTFTLIQEYEGRLLLRHCDTYRLRNPDEFFELGLDELFATDGVAFVEWANRVEDDLPADRLVISITIDSPTHRSFELQSTGPRSAKILQDLIHASGSAI